MSRKPHLALGVILVPGHTRLSLTHYWRLRKPSSELNKTTTTQWYFRGILIHRPYITEPGRTEAWTVILCVSFHRGGLEKINTGSIITISLINRWPWLNKILLVYYKRQKLSQCKNNNVLALYLHIENIILRKYIKRVQHRFHPTIIKTSVVCRAADWDWC